MKAHSTVTSPLSEDTSHPAENDKHSESGFVLDASIRRLELQLSLVAMVFARSETGQQRLQANEKKKRKKKKIGLYMLVLNHHQLCGNGPLSGMVHKKKNHDIFLIFYDKHV